MFKIPHSYPTIDSDIKNILKKVLHDEFLGESLAVVESINKLLLDLYPYRYSQLLPSASLGFLMVLKYLKVGNKDQVILPAINCPSMLNTINMEDATPVLCDVRSVMDFRTNAEMISRQVTANTKLIVITHMFGVQVENSEVQKLKESFSHIPILEDYSTCPIKSKKNMIYSDFCLMSFGSTKPVSVGTGGVLLSNKQVVNPSYDSLQDNLSLNCKMSNLDLNVLLQQLKKADNHQKMRNKVVNWLSKYVEIYGEDEFLFRAICFSSVNKLLTKADKIGIELDIRNSVQPNLSKTMNKTTLNNAFNFNDYFSIPINIQFYRFLVLRKEIKPI